MLCPTVEALLEEDVSIDVANDAFNAAHGLQQFNVGFRVIEPDLLLQNLTAADKKLLAVFGDTIHHNNGKHLDGGIADDAKWQKRWKMVVSTSLPLWYAPKGKVGRRFVQLLTSEWRGVRLRQWNLEKPIVFAAVILRMKKDVTAASAIKKHHHMSYGFVGSGALRRAGECLRNRGQTRDG